MKQVIISMSGGKDSTAMRLLAIKKGIKHRAVMADTGNEHDETYRYIEYLEDETGPIEKVKADFSAQIEKKGLYVKTKWKGKGVSDKDIERALDFLKPTGNPFLDLCIWKGRFPSSKAQFCTSELKVFPITEKIILPALEIGPVESWQGVRADESINRRNLPMTEDQGGGLTIHRPILKWNVEKVFEEHRLNNIKPNPLYKQGMGRVGCMPCINCTKNELKEISNRFPEVIQKVSEWEEIVGNASKIGTSTFFSISKTPGPHRKNDSLPIPKIHEVVRWSKTKRGGKHFDIFSAPEFSLGCSSAYGLCE